MNSWAVGNRQSEARGWTSTTANYNCTEYPHSLVDTRRATTGHASIQTNWSRTKIVFQLQRSAASVLSISACALALHFHSTCIHLGSSASAFGFLNLDGCLWYLREYGPWNILDLGQDGLQCLAARPDKTTPTTYSYNHRCAFLFGEARHNYVWSNFWSWVM